MNSGGCLDKNETNPDPVTKGNPQTSLWVVSFPQDTRLLSIIIIEQINFFNALNHTRHVQSSSIV